MIQLPSTFLDDTKRSFGFLLLGAGYHVEREWVGESFDIAGVTFASERLRIEIERDRGYTGVQVKALGGTGSCDRDILQRLLAGADSYRKDVGTDSLEAFVSLLRERLSEVERLFSPERLVDTIARVGLLQAQRANLLFGQVGTDQRAV
jgi:hypothetical protein